MGMGMVAGAEDDDNVHRRLAAAADSGNDDNVLAAVPDNVPDPDRDGSSSSAGASSPDHDHDHEDDQERDLVPEAEQQEPVQPPKRKGGRKPIYATSEERKQRNRQAQAAFRERRTEYIKQLEATIKQNEDSLSSLQQSHRSAADECLMLRYKNSLLERILLEKGVDVQTELQMKTGSPMGLQHPAANIPAIPANPPALQRTAVQRQHARRSGTNFLPRITPGQTMTDGSYQTSPHGHPTPSSHASSPTNPSTRSPMSYQSMTAPPTMSAVLSPNHGQMNQLARMPHQAHNTRAVFSAQQQLSPTSPQNPNQQSTARYQGSGNVMTNNPISGHASIGQSTPLNGNIGSTASSYYPSPFQKHIDQLEQEYDRQESQSMLEQDDSANSVPGSAVDPMQGSFPPSFEQQQQRPSDFYQKNTMQNTSVQSDGYSTGAGGMQANSAFIPMDLDPNDPILNADPFGLSASMHYPTSYSFEQPPPQQ